MRSRRQECVRSPLARVCRAALALYALAAAPAFADHILNDTDNGPHPVLDWPKDFHIGIAHIERTACPEAKPKCRETLVIKSGQSAAFRLSAFRFELNYVARRTGPGPDLIVTASTGGAHCCYTVHALWLDPKLHDQEIPVADNDEVGFLAVVDELPKLKFGDFNFAYWRASFADSPAPAIILHFDRASGRFEPDIEAMRRPAPDDATLTRMVLDIRKAETQIPKGEKPPAPLLWQHMLDLIYSGNAESARRLLDQAWPAQRPGKDEFFACFTGKLVQGEWWRSAKLGEKLGADAAFPAKAGKTCPEGKRG